MAPPPGVPTLDQLIDELGLLRGPGLLQLRRLEVNALYRAAVCAGFADTADKSGLSAGIEVLLQVTADNLSSDNLRTAARYTFGLVEGTEAGQGKIGERRQRTPIRAVRIASANITRESP
jgi:hypothetical protein